MRRFLIIMTAVLGIAMSSCSRHTSLQVDIAELNEGRAYIVFADPDQINARQQENLAEAEILNGKAIFDLDNIQFESKYKDCSITIISQSSGFQTTFPLPLERGKAIRLIVTGIKELRDKGEPLHVSYSGSKQAEDFSDYWKQVISTYQRIAKGEDYNKLCQEQVDICKQFLEKYPMSAYPYTILLDGLRGAEMDNPIVKYCEQLSLKESKNKWHNLLIEAYKDKVRKAVLSKKMVFSAKDIEGNNFSERDFLGKKVLLHFWASKSEKCIENLGQVAKLEQVCKSQGIELVSISIDPQPNEWIKWSKSNKLNHTSLWADGQIITQRYSFNDIPMFMLFDQDGMLINSSPNPSSLL